MYFLNEAISKELMGEILNLNITYIEHCNNSIVYKISVYDREEEINIYELAHKCKEWAYENGYYLTIYNDAIDIILQTNCKMVENITNGSYRYSPRLIFKACQWILDNKDK